MPVVLITLPDETFLNEIKYYAMRSPNLESFLYAFIKCMLVTHTTNNDRGKHKSTEGNDVMLFPKITSFILRF